MQKGGDVSFPRGNTKKRVKSVAKRSQDDLFKVRSDAPKLKKKKLHHKKSVQDEDDTNSVVLEHPNIQIYGAGLSVLGCIKAIYNSNITVELPGGLTGTIPITGISQIYTDSLKKFVENNSAEDVPELSEMFYVGQLLPCYVSSLAEDPKSFKKSIKLSIDPSKINSDLSSVLLRNKTVLVAVVRDVEDHGYVIDLGIKGINTFLKNEDSDAYERQRNEGIKLKVGQVIQCMIVIPDSSNPAARISGRIVNVTCDPDLVCSATMTKAMNINQQALIPGMLIPCNVTKIIKDGLIVKCLQYDGCIPRLSLTSSTTKPEDYSIDQRLIARLLYVHPVTKILYLTLSSDVVEKNNLISGHRFPDYRVGDIIDNAVVCCGHKNGIELKIDDRNVAFCKTSNLSDSSITDVRSSFPVGSAQRCRVIGLNILNNSIYVSLRKSILERTIISIDDLVVSNIYECEIFKLFPAGILVKLAPNVTGFVPGIHMSDAVITHPEKKFKIGMKIKCRLLSVEASNKSDKKSVKLTHKNSLLNSKYPLVTDLGNVKPGMISDGYVVYVDDKKLLVAFYNNITGVITNKEMGFEKIENVSEIFRKGQVVKCQVIGFTNDKKKLLLTLKVNENRNFFVQSDDSLFGIIFKVRIHEKTFDGFNVRIQPDDSHAFVPTSHLSDILHLCPLLHEAYQVGDIMEAVCFTRKRLTLMSAKMSLIDAAKKEQIIRDISDVKNDMFITGIVSNVVNYGVFVQFIGRYSGLAPIKKLDVDGLDNDDGSYNVNQSVIAKVAKVDVERERIELSLKMRDVYDGDIATGVGLLNSYLNNLDHLLMHYGSIEGEKKSLSKLRIGTIVKVKVDDTNRFGFTGSVVRPEIGCICVADHLEESKQTRVGDVVEAVVVSIDVGSCSVQVCALQSVLDKIRLNKDNWHSRVHERQKLKCDVILIHDDYILVCLRGHANGKLAFLPNKKHLNDTHGRKELFQLFGVYPVSVQTVVNDKIIVSLNASDSRPKLTSLKPLVDKRKSEHSETALPNSVVSAKRMRRDSACSDVSLDSDSGTRIKKHSLQLGQVCDAVIRAVKDSQMNIRVNNKVPGRVHVSEVADDVTEGVNPLSNFKPGQNIKVRIIGFREVISRSFLPVTRGNFSLAIPECSSKPSVVKDENFKVESFDERTPRPGQTIDGYFKTFSNSYMYLRLTPKFDGRLDVMNYSTDVKVLRAVPNMKVGAAITTTVQSVNSDLINLTNTGAKSVEAGNVLLCKVLSTRSTIGALMRLPLGYRGYLDLTDISDTFESAKSLLTKLLSKMYVNCCVLRVNHSSKECVLSARNSRTKRNWKRTVENREVTDIGELLVGDVVSGFVTSASKKYLNAKIGREIVGKVVRVPDENVTFELGSVVDFRVADINPAKKDVRLLILKKGNETQGDDNSELLEENSDVEDASSDEENDDGSKSTPKSSELGSSAGFVWDNDLALIAPVDNKDDDDSEDGDGEKIRKNKRKSKRQKRQEKLKEEDHLYLTERMLMEDDRPPQSVDEFDRAVLSSPDSSIVWIQYMAHHLENAEVDKARNVADRALKTISFREEQEKFNVWVSLLNLENLYGTTESLQDVLQRALQYCEPYQIYKKLVDIYVSSDKIIEAETLFNVMLKKFQRDKQTWIDCGTFMMKNERFDSARNLMRRSLKSVDNKDHIDILVKFAQMEISMGDVERGKTMFENVLGSYPKRSDIWSIFIDLLIHHGDISAVRKVLDGAMNLKLPLKKMKFFFKRYVNLEETFGTPESVEHIKQKIVDFVEQKSF